mgnify:CR=1 FL=1
MSDLNIEALIDFKKDWNPRLLIVRVSTNYFKSKNGALVYQRKVKPLSKKSTQDALEVLYEEVEIGGIDYMLKGIINLNDVDDGVYELKMVNITHDWETGHIDGWDWKLFKISVDN